jgi:hypothetical protein
MAEFNPTAPALVYDELNDRVFAWRPDEWGKDFATMSSRHGPDLIEWDGLLLAGWLPQPAVS